MQEGICCLLHACACNTMRCCPQIGFLGPAFFLTQLGKVHSPFAAVACMMASQGLDAFSQSGLYSNHQVPSSSCCSQIARAVAHTGQWVVYQPWAAWHMPGMSAPCRLQ